MLIKSMNRSAQLRHTLKNDKILVLPGVYDCLSAMIAERTGFKAVFTSGFGISASAFGKPDYGLVSSSEMIGSVCRIADSVNVPLVADIDNGYGNHLNVIRTIEQLSKYNIAGVILEDQKWPKRCGHMEGKQVIESSEHVEKLKAARSANSDLVIIARTDSRAVYGLDEAVRRGYEYLDAGADILFIEAPQSLEELKTIGSTFPDNYLFANMIEGGKTPVLGSDELAEMNFKVVVYPLTGLFSTTHRLHNVYSQLFKEKTSNNITGLTDFSEFEDIIKIQDYQFDFKS